MAQAIVNGAALAWQQMGQGRDVILIHGLAANRAFWFPLASALQAHCHVTLFDLRGHGYSSTTASGYSSVDMGRDLLALMDALGMSSASVIGHSYGGGAALEAACIAPQRFERLALLDTRVQRLQPEMRLRDLDRLSAFEQALLDDAGGPTALDDETQIGFRFLEQAARRRLQGALGDRDEFVPFGEGSGARRAASAWLRLLDQTHARTEFVQAGADEARIAQLRLPLLLMYGERSRCWPSAHALARLCPQAHTIRVAGAGHFFPISAFGPTLAGLSDFLATPQECVV